MIDTSSKEEKDFKKSIEHIKTWKTQRKRFTEESYKIELRNFLDNYNYVIDEEKGETNIDLLLNKTIAIELKKDPSTSEYDRLLGQMIRHFMHYKFLVVVICDVSSTDRYNEFLKRVEFINSKMKFHLEIIAK